MRYRLRAECAQDLAERLLAPCPERLLHTEGVARRAGILASPLGISDPDLLVAAAWLHDIGYAPAARQSGFHPLDGALLLDSLRGARMSVVWWRTTPALGSWPRCRAWGPGSGSTRSTTRR